MPPSTPVSHARRVTQGDAIASTDVDEGGLLPRKLRGCGVNARSLGLDFQRVKWLYLRTRHRVRDMLGASDKVRADRLRRKLDRMGYRLMKSGARDPDDLTYDGFQVVTLAGELVAGHGNLGRGFSLTLDDVEAWIAKRSVQS